MKMGMMPTMVRTRTGTAKESVLRMKEYFAE
jgi:hypothetical protein